MHIRTDSVVWILGVHHSQIRPGCAEIRAPFQYNVHVSMVRTDLCVLAPSLCECQQSVLGCEQQGGDAEAVVAPLSRLEDFSLNNVAGQSCVFTVSGDAESQYDTEKRNYASCWMRHSYSVLRWPYVQQTIEVDLLHANLLIYLYEQSKQGINLSPTHYNVQHAAMTSQLIVGDIKTLHDNLTLMNLKLFWETIWLLAFPLLSWITPHLLIVTLQCLLFLSLLWRWCIVTMNLNNTAY